MTKQEFEQLIGKKVGNGEYSLIEEVYTFYPTISETKGKEQIAYLYTNFGMRIIIDMLSTARLANDYEADIIIAREKLEALQSEYSSFKSGAFSVRVKR